MTAAEVGVVRPVTSVLQTTQKPELCEFVHESGWGNPDHEVGALHPACLAGSEFLQMQQVETSYPSVLFKSLQ